MKHIILMLSFVFIFLPGVSHAAPDTTWTFMYAKASVGCNGTTPDLSKVTVFFEMAASGLEGQQFVKGDFAIDGSELILHVPNGPTLDIGQMSAPECWFGGEQPSWNDVYQAEGLSVQESFRSSDSSYSLAIDGVTLKNWY